VYQLAPPSLVNPACAKALEYEQQCLVCNAPDQPERRVPKSDVLALIGEQCVILHCDHSYRPIGKTISLGHVIHPDLFEAQIKHHPSFAENLWKRLIRAKTENQSAVLVRAGAQESLQCVACAADIEESAAARKYWHAYFLLFPKPPKLREHQEAKNQVNQMLNYGYAVLSAILHRSITVHGFNPAAAGLGIHHRYRFKSDRASARKCRSLWML
jgi:CRISPR-associated protein Cas1